MSVVLARETIRCRRNIVFVSCTSVFGRRRVFLFRDRFKIEKLWYEFGFLISTVLLGWMPFWYLAATIGVRSPLQSRLPFPSVETFLSC
jgi:hypothetical protein